MDVTIDAAAIDSGDLQETAQTLADLVLAAYRDACRAVDELQEQTMAPFAAGFGGAGTGLPGMPDLSGIPGLMGQPGSQEPPDDEAAPGTPDDEHGGCRRRMSG